MIVLALVMALVIIKTSALLLKLYLNYQIEAGNNTSSGKKGGVLNLERVLRRALDPFNNGSWTNETNEF